MEKEEFLSSLLDAMKPFIWKKDVKLVKNTISKCFDGIEIRKIDDGNPITNEDALKLFVDAVNVNFKM